MKRNNKIGLLIGLCIIVLVSTNYKVLFGGYFFSDGVNKYERDDYLQSEISFLLALKFNHKQKGYHNLGNLYYRLGEQKIEISEKLTDLNKSLRHYKKSLEIGPDTETQENYDFVLKKIEELENQGESEGNNTEQENSDESRGDNQEPSSNDQNSEDTNSDKSDENIKNGEESDQNSGGSSDQTSEQLGKNQDAGEDTLTQEESDKIEKHIENLKKQEQLNQKYYNKSEQKGENPFDIFSDQFGGDPFFDSVYDRGGEKDW